MDLISKLSGWRNSSINHNSYFSLRPMHLDSDCWVHYSLENLYKQIFYDVLSLTTGLKDGQANIMYNNSSIDYHARYGLIHYLVESYIGAKEIYLRLVPNNRKPMVEKVVGEYESVNDNSVIKVSFKHFNEPAQLYQLFALQYQVLQYIHAGMCVASTPAFKISDLRASSGSPAERDIKKQIQDITNSFSSSHNAIVLDGADSIDFSSFDSTSAEKLNDIIIGLISTVTGLPKSYIGANRSSSLGDSGNADEKQFLKSIRRYFYEIFKGVVDSLLDTDIQLKSTTKEDISWKIDMLNQLDSISEEVLDSKMKEQLMSEIYNVK